MNWEDATVNLDDYLAEMGWVLSKDGLQYAWLKQMRDRQAKLTWEARQEEIDEAEQRGVKKVVDWMKLHKAYLCFDESDPAEIKNLNKAWQAFLKECEE